MTEKPKFNDDTLEKVYLKIMHNVSIGAIDIPAGYSVANALQGAYYAIKDSKTGKPDFKPYLEVVDRDDLYHCLYKMVCDGLSVVKRQCAFILRGKTLCYEREYQGAIALAKRYSGVISVRAKVVREGEQFITKTAPDGRTELVRHDDCLEFGDKPIIGAYAVITESDGSPDLVKMTIQEIKESWGFSNKSQSDVNDINRTQKTFAQEMCKKTVIKRATKPYINSSDDTAVMENKIDKHITQIDKPNISHNLIGLPKEPTKQQNKIEPIQAKITDAEVMPEIVRKKEETEAETEEDWD